jgi:hypothetical protein
VFAATATLLLLASSTTSNLAQAGQLDHRLMGAWAPSASDCKEVFQSRNGKLVFRQPVNSLYTAFIISPRQISATTGQCRVDNVVVKDGHQIASLNCRNGIGYSPISARFKIVNENEITYGSSDSTILDSNYERCR